MGIRGAPTGEVTSTAAGSRPTAGWARRARASASPWRCSTAPGPAIAAQALGLAQGAIDHAVEYARQRMAFGKPIAAQQGLQFMLADMQTRTEAARLLLYRVGEMIDEGVTGPELTRLAAMASCLLATWRWR